MSRRVSQFAAVPGLMVLALGPLFAEGAREASSAPASKWSMNASVAAYFVPDDQDFLLPTISGDRGALHLEARYNYEDLRTASLWVGFNWAGGQKVPWTLMPLVGGVFGETRGMAPGFKGSVGWRALEFYSEGEYVFDFDAKEDSFFYSWSELSLSAMERFRVGLVAQRTRVYQTERDIQRGLLAGVRWRETEFTAYVFNPDDEKPMVVLSASSSF